MPPLTITQLQPLHAMADRIAGGLRRRLHLQLHDQEDLRQDILTDFLARLRHYNAAQGELAAFALTCFRHRAARLAVLAARERAARHPLSLDDMLPSGTTLGSTVAESDGVGAWLGQTLDSYGDVDRRLDVARAAEGLSADDASLCCALLRGEPHAAQRAGLSRTTAFRRLREMRLALSARGIASAA